VEKSRTNTNVKAEKMSRIAEIDAQMEKLQAEREKELEANRVSVLAPGLQDHTNRIERCVESTTETDT
jgi:hypothetical protein